MQVEYFVKKNLLILSYILCLIYMYKTISSMIHQEISPIRL